VPDPAVVFREMIEAFDAGDTARMRGFLADDIVAYVTNADGGADRVEGVEAYLARLPDTSEAEYTVSVTQTVRPAPDQVLAMVDVQAQRHGRELHNHAGFLARIVDDRIVEVWMVDALPAYSDEFWS
jgi:ketosteroid isomerase-like protein